MINGRVILFFIVLIVLAVALCRFIEWLLTPYYERKKRQLQEAHRRYEKRMKGLVKKEPKRRVRPRDYKQ